MMRLMANGKPGRRSLGPRDTTPARLPLAVHALVEHAAAARGIDRGAFLADVICYHAGRADLMRHLHQDTLLAPPIAHHENAEGDGNQLRRITVRIPPAVRHVVERAAAEQGTDRCTYLSDLICAHMGRPDLTRAIHREVMPLAM